MTISEAQSVLHCPDAYGGIYGEKYGQAMEVAFKCMDACGGAVERAFKIYKAESEVQDADSD